MNILLVEDDLQLANSIKKNLLEEGFYVQIASDGQRAIEIINQIKFDVIILDWMIPKISGIEVCKKIREMKINSPIILLTVLSNVNNKLNAFNSGADDYLTKPFEMKELIARIKVVYRRYSSNSTIIEYKEISLDLYNRTVYTTRGEIKLTDREFDLLKYFINHSGEIVSKEKLFNEIWGMEYDPYSNVIEVTIKNLRKKLEEKLVKNPIKNVYGEGYIFI